MAYHELGEHKKAIKAYKEAIRFDPKTSSSYYNLGQAYFDNGNRRAALDQHKILQTVDPQLANKLYLLVREATYHRLNVNILDKVGRDKLNPLARAGYTIPEAKPVP